ncbi:hypothetical protein CEXT_334041 [Caerostris extrusa]|uniref:Ribosomal protein L20 n=1 Tax=Caerostris extrusa TaxID=172846 RepID=A0AAV4XXG0_CAEEX|nr:hypothetical protein CEXT_334041 [Caerostris extrusa]
MSNGRRKFHRKRSIVLLPKHRFRIAVCSSNIYHRRRLPTFDKKAERSFSANLSPPWLLLKNSVVAQKELIGKTRKCRLEEVLFRKDEIQKRNINWKCCVKVSIFVKRKCTI